MSDNETKSTELPNNILPADYLIGAISGGIKAGFNDFIAKLVIGITNDVLARVEERLGEKGKSDG